MEVKVKKMEKPEYVQCLGCFVSQAVAFAAISMGATCAYVAVAL